MILLLLCFYYPSVYSQGDCWTINLCMSLENKSFWLTETVWLHITGPEIIFQQYLYLCWVMYQKTSFPSKYFVKHTKEEIFVYLFWKIVFDGNQKTLIFLFVCACKNESLQPCRLLSKAFLKCRNTYSEDEAANTLSELARILEKIVTTVEPRDSSISSSFTIFLSFCTTSFTLSEVSCCPSPVRFRSWLAISAAFSVSIQNQAKSKNNALQSWSSPEIQIFIIIIESQGMFYGICNEHMISLFCQTYNFLKKVYRMCWLYSILIGYVFLFFVLIWVWKSELF